MKGVVLRMAAIVFKTFMHPGEELLSKEWYWNKKECFSPTLGQITDQIMLSYIILQFWWKQSSCESCGKKGFGLVYHVYNRVYDEML